MTQETLDRANEITNKIKELEKTLGSLEYRVNTRDKDIKLHQEGKKRWIPVPKWFCRGVIKEDGKVVFDAPVECQRPLDFELDEECVDFILKHERDKIEKLRKELEEL